MSVPDTQMTTAQTQAAGFKASPLARRFASIGGLLLSLFLTFLGLLLFTFIIGRVVPADPVLTIVGEGAPEEVYRRVRMELGLDQPIWEQFRRYLVSLLSGNFGISTITARPVMEDILHVFPATLELATIATIFGVIIGIPTGIFAAVYRDRLFDQIVRVLGLIGYSVPVFWLGLVALLIFYVKLDLVPAHEGRVGVAYDGIVPSVTGMITIDSLLSGDFDVFWDALHHILLPAALLGYFSLAYISRMTRSFMLEQLRQEYIVTARIKGAPEWRVIWVHALRNIRIPLITVIALSYGGLLEGSVLTETVFAWPGLGQYITHALFGSDRNAVLGGTIVVGVVFVTLNLISDFLYRILDPRTR
ncbi:MAG: ABC transporter permease [Alphaproteobacteria bacterium]